MGIYAANVDERMLRRIILTLASLAVLAERAALRNDRVCCLVVWILQGAEVAVGDLVFDATGTPPPEFAAMTAGDGLRRRCVSPRASRRSPQSLAPCC